MSTDDLRPSAREVVDVARRARTPSLAQRDRAYQALLAGLSGGAAVGTAKVAGKSALLWLKWAIPVALVIASAGTYAWRAQHHAKPSARAVDAAPPMAPLAAPVAPLASVVAPSASVGVDQGPMPSSLPSARAQGSARPSHDDLMQELSLLHQALAASRSGDAAGALDLARQHAQRYPNSRLRNERDAIEVRSLCALGRAPDAKKIADRLRERAPNSPVSASLQDSCVGK
ncbi:MAG TPA: hypothetical protein VGF76_13705 [Polyangiaceae bacterium]|jgi:TolA-binding protein